MFKKIAYMHRSFDRSSWADAAKPPEEAHAGHSFQFPGLWLRVGQPG